MTDPVYLDHCSTTPVDERVLEAMLPWFGARAGNASGTEHVRSWRAADAVVKAREQVAALVGANPTEIVFTSGATESLFTGIGSELSRASTQTVLVGATEHPAVYDALATRRPRRVVRIGVDRNGIPSLDRIDSALRKWPGALVVVMTVNNELGTLMPIEAIGRVVRAGGARWLSDLTQAAGRIPIDVGTSGVHLATLSSHKVYGPPGVGALVVAGGGPPLVPLIGGSQESGRRGGTTNVPGVVGFGAACALSLAEGSGEAARIGSLRDRFEDALRAALDGVWINGIDAPRVPHVSSVGVQGVDGRTLVRDMADVALSTRAACSSGSAGPSHVLDAIGLDSMSAASCVRICLGRYTTEAEIDHALDRMVASVRRLRRAMPRVTP